MKDDTRSVDEPDDDRDVAAALAVATMGPADQFRARLRTQLEDTAAGAPVVALDPSARATAAPRRRWPLVLSAAAAVVLVVAVALVLRPSDDELDPAGPTLTGAELVDALTGRTWVILDRLDVGATPARVPLVTFAGSADDLELDVRGCGDAVGSGRIDGATLTIESATGASVTCDDAPPLAIAGDIEMRPDAATFLLRSAGGSPLAEFTDVDSLTPPSGDDLIDGEWLDEQLGSLDFVWPDLAYAGLCTRLTWEDQGDDVTIRLGDEVTGACSVDSNPPFGLIEPRVRDVVERDAVILATPGGILIQSSAGGLHLRQLPIADVDPARATVAAGALFGFAPAVGIAPDDLLAAAEPVVGRPDLDSGWVDFAQIDTASRGQCSGEYREIVWGDVAAGFTQIGSRTEFLYWNVGDHRAIQGNLLLDPPTFAPSGLTTEEGAGIGDAAAAIDLRFGMRIDDWTWADGTTVRRLGVASRDPDSAGGSIETRGLGGAYWIIDDELVAFGAGVAIC